MTTCKSIIRAMLVDPYSLYVDLMAKELLGVMKDDTTEELFRAVKEIREVTPLMIAQMGIDQALHFIVCEVLRETGQKEMLHTYRAAHELER